MEASTSQTKLLMRLPYSSTSSYALEFSMNGTYLALTETHGSQEDVSVARVDDGTMVELHDDPLEAEVELLPFFEQLVTTSGGRLVTLSESGNRAVLSYQEGETASIITYVPLGEYEFVWAPQDLIALWNAKHHRLILLDPQNREQPILLNEEATLWKWNASQDVSCTQVDTT